MIHSQNEQMQRQLEESTNVNRRIPEFEQRIRTLSDEIERLNGVIEKKNGEISSLSQRLTEAEAMSMTISVLQQKVSGLLN